MKLSRVHFHSGLKTFVGSLDRQLRTRKRRALQHDDLKQKTSTAPIRTWTPRFSIPSNLPSTSIRLPSPPSDPSSSDSSRFDSTRSPSPNASMDNHAAVHESDNLIPSSEESRLVLEYKLSGILRKVIVGYELGFPFPSPPNYAPSPSPPTLLYRLCKLPAELFNLILRMKDEETTPEQRFYESMIDRVLIQSDIAPSADADKRTNGFEEVAAKKSQLASTIPYRSDPLYPSDFRRANERVHDIGRAIETAYFHWQRVEDTSALDVRLDSLLKSRQHFLDISFDIFAQMIGAKDPNYEGLVTFNKKEADRALEQAIGSISKSNDQPEVFVYPGCIPLDFNDDIDAARGFSLYLGRKGYSNVDPRASREETEAFAERVGTPLIPPSDPQYAPSKTNALILLRRVCEVMFKPHAPTHYYERPPNSGKSCLEVPLSKGGKRSAIYQRKCVNGDINHVRADTILSAGKFRTITVSSAYYSKYSWLNGYMFSRLRKCKWMVSGKTVDAWVESIGDMDGEWFCSGDGKACTDYFDSDYCDVVLNYLAKTFDLSLEELQSFTTHAVIEVNGRFILQQRGQLMGSDFSFPILCLLSLFAHLIGEDLVDIWIERPDRELYLTVLDYHGCGVNGDDIVSWGDSSSPSRWLRGFNVIGGVANSAKSPVSREYFTINSQLWRRAKNESRPHKIGAILPAMLLGICGKAHLAPDESWADLLSSPLLTPESIKRSQIDLVLLPDLPRSLGGLGTDFSPISSKLLKRRYLWALASRKRNWHSLVDFSSDHVDVSLGRVSVCSDHKERSKIPPVSGWIRTSEKKRLAEEAFGSPRGLFWTDPDGKSSSPFWIRRWVYHKSQQYCDLKFIHELMIREHQGWSHVRSVHPYATEVQDPKPAKPAFYLLEPRSVQEEVKSFVERETFKKRLGENPRRGRFNSVLTLPST
uniref:Replicase n=1 Tax=Agaricus bisporus virus 14 TaxID=1945744 RepID=A0A1Q1N6J8_9VIRU|nr:replicase [Agaricus bisporus virus 14]